MKPAYPLRDDVAEQLLLLLLAGYEDHRLVPSCLLAEPFCSSSELPVPPGARQEP